MSAGDAPPAGSFLEPLRGGGALEVDGVGVTHPRSGRRGRPAVRTAWADLTHVSVAPRGLQLATRSRAFMVVRGAFAEPWVGPERAARAVRAGARAAPGGEARTARMEALDTLVERPGPVRVSAFLVAACLGAFVLQVFFPAVHYAGLFSASLVQLGEPWRLVTANLLHGSPAHLILNLLGVWVVGWMVERSFGSRGAALVIGLAAFGAMGASWLRGYEAAMGASGIVYGLAGALFWLEFRRPETLPAAWRIPRVALGVFVVAELVMALSVDWIAHAALWGGLVGGLFGAAWAGPRIAGSGGVRPGLRLALAVLAGAVGLSVFALARNVVAPDPAAVARRGEQLLEQPGIPPHFLNNEAWRIAIAPGADSESLAVARQMAERAVEETAGREPALLDTLAEILFRSGDGAAAVALIDAAIHLDPGERYYREQRRRFSGERAADDRPADPAPWRGPPEPPPEPDSGGPPGGIRV
jgi:membrane associated rhomboid family serine protease